MHAHPRRTTTSLGLSAVVFLVIGAVSTIDRIPAVGELYAQTSWRGLVVAPEQRCSPYDAEEVERWRRHLVAVPPLQPVKMR